MDSLPGSHRGSAPSSLHAGTLLYSIVPLIAEQPNNWTLSIEKSGQPPFRNNSLLDPMAVVLFAFYSHRLDWPNYIPIVLHDACHWVELQAVNI
jgi:hypothetical protein